MLSLTGICRGLKSDVKMINNVQIREVHLGIEQVVQNGYAGQTEIVDVRFDKRHVDAGLQAKFEQLVGFEISVPVYVRPWSSKNGRTGYALHLSGEGLPFDVSKNVEQKADKK